MITAKNNLEKETDNRLTNLLVKADIPHPENYTELLAFIVEELEAKGIDSPTNEETAEALKTLLETFKK
jgi:hydroxyethylthiazole kinase-like sugar kinase family protein